ncbi:hypothetical protein [Duganella sp. HH105]|uniref:hypothetical protein n=1 Tax=Duganella sp. HH105 TaxID=1781067 RepID=UPI000877CA1A|nr:hypothetical protein [Duganella sp. HH105]OEZ57550.1 hypothetical protein DUGA6_44490 [Duganella sp. HH105]
MKSLLALMLVSTAAMADDGAMLRCRQLTDAPARLACYDAIQLGAPVAAAAGAAPAVAAAPTRADLERSFGKEQLVAPVKLDSIETSINGEFDGWVPNQRIRLANGQVWMIADDSQENLSLNNPKVKIERGLMGAIFMDIDGARSAPRVKRVK